ncbi:putative Thiamine pyrophosphokinase 1 [Blattamonas nauphoetae]|uniref:Thiamine pyrophosphokinase 1 n=1 Tax=Blattamonas nauphoetae TaxID=2049346 RepID=A0ABQ9YMD6_9EUKA|nr:putative Thiamine pyrophosphokinase 1 [Blattamonas nauphoetae]
MVKVSFDEALKDFVVLLLNYRLPLLTPTLIRHAKRVICLDGGLNLFDRLREDNPILKDHFPHSVIGDFDSVEKDLLTKYKQLGSDVDHDTDQDTNDMEKGFTYLLSEYEHADRSQLYSPAIFVVGALGGRFDQEMANISAMVKFQTKFQKLSPKLPPPQIFILSNSSLITTLLPSKEISSEPSSHHHTIIQSRYETNPCGIIPLGKCDHVLTTGLKWNVNGPLEFGTFISSSNEIEHQDNPVTIDNSQTLLWTSMLKSESLHNSFPEPMT